MPKRLMSLSPTDLAGIRELGEPKIPEAPAIPAMYGGMGDTPAPPNPPNPLHDHFVQFEASLKTIITRIEDAAHAAILRLELKV